MLRAELGLHMGESATGDPRRTNFLEWCVEVGNQMTDIYCLTIDDAGIDQGYLIRRWRSDDTPEQFVSWYGNKYDLDRISDLRA